jgi:hypothetical protein
MSHADACGQQLIATHTSHWLALLEMEHATTPPLELELLPPPLQIPPPHRPLQHCVGSRQGTPPGWHEPPLLLPLLALLPPLLLLVLPPLLLALLLLVLPPLLPVLPPLLLLLPLLPPPSGPASPVVDGARAPPQPVVPAPPSDDAATSAHASDHARETRTRIPASASRQCSAPLTPTGASPEDQPPSAPTTPMNEAHDASSGDSVICDAQVPCACEAALSHMPPAQSVSTPHGYPSGDAAMHVAKGPPPLHASPSAHWLKPGEQPMLTVASAVHACVIGAQ